MPLGVLRHIADDLPLSDRGAWNEALKPFSSGEWRAASDEHVVVACVIAADDKRLVTVITDADGRASLFVQPAVGEGSGGLVPINPTPQG